MPDLTFRGLRAELAEGGTRASYDGVWRSMTLWRFFARHNYTRKKDRARQ